MLAFSCCTFHLDCLPFAREHYVEGKINARRSPYFHLGTILFLSLALFLLHLFRVIDPKSARSSRTGEKNHFLRKLLMDAIHISRVTKAVAFFLFHFPEFRLMIQLRVVSPFLSPDFSPRKTENRHAISDKIPSLRRTFFSEEPQNSVIKSRLASGVKDSSRG